MYVLQYTLGQYRALVYCNIAIPGLLSSSSLFPHFLSLLRRAPGARVQTCVRRRCDSCTKQRPQAMAAPGPDGRVSTPPAQAVAQRKRPSSEAAVCLSAVARGFAVGYGVKVVVEVGRCLIAALTSALRARSSSSPTSSGSSSNAAALHHLGQALRAFANPRSVRFGAFLAGALGLYRIVLALSSRALGRRCGDPLHPAQVVLAGSCAALAIAADSGIDTGDRRRTLTLYAVAKSMQYALEVLEARGTVPALPSLPGWIFTAACGQIMFAWFYHPHSAIALRCDCVRCRHSSPYHRQRARSCVRACVCVCVSTNEWMALYWSVFIFCVLVLYVLCFVFAPCFL